MNALCPLPNASRAFGSPNCLPECIKRQIYTSKVCAMEEQEPLTLQKKIALNENYGVTAAIRELAAALREPRDTAVQRGLPGYLRAIFGTFPMQYRTDFRPRNSSRDWIDVVWSWYPDKDVVFMRLQLGNGNVIAEWEFKLEDRLNPPWVNR